MVRILFLVASLSGLGACTSWPAKGGPGASWQAAEPAAGGFRFDWRLSGDPAVAPMQVFDNGREVWLQFAPGQALPAVFGVRGDGEHALPYVRRDPYVVVKGEWGVLRFRGGRLAARAERGDDMARIADVSTQSMPLAAPGVGALAAGGPLTVSGRLTSEGPASVAAPAQPRAPLPLPAAPVETYRAAPPDATLRAVLARWADGSGWTFQPQHWAVDVDIPLSASADFPGDFKSAVRGLLAATELAEKPLQPCFYGNQVLRVVPLAQSCSRTASPQGGGA
ncbi:TrbG/VirB9 family P-type conjugative transfer protein [Achromobacter marplatensis]|uniref:TcpQ domain-containing protein n=1 Tax=Achromobacter marplatensis TaxID=470868 RepID=UPI0039F7401D